MPNDTSNTSQKPRTMVDKIWDAHQVYSEAGQPDILYIDLHLVHEVTSPQAFEGLRLAGPQSAAAGADRRHGRP